MANPTNRTRGWHAALLTLAAAGCASPQYRPVSDTPVRIGRPYAVRGETYVPAADPAYDRLGYASWYGPESGSRTANGEQFRPDGLSAAHTTLPLPSYVEVTSLATGRTILVRVNDRGPFSGAGRIIDLSRGAAQALDLRAHGPTPVRVRVVDPTQSDRARLRQGHAAASRPAASEADLDALRQRWQSEGPGHSPR